MLAQSWLYGERTKSEVDHMVERHLKLPTKFDKHSSLAVLNLLAERIVFTDDVPTILYEMNDNKQITFDGMLTSARLPYDCFWMEYTTNIGIVDDDEIDYAMYGALIQRIGTEEVRMYIIIGIKFADVSDVLSTVAYVIDFPHWPPVVSSTKYNNSKALSFEVRYAFNYARLQDAKLTRALVELGSIVNELIFGIFLLTQPRVYTDEPVRWKSSHKKARATRNKPPLLEYRRIRLHICKPRKHYTQRPAITSGISDTDSDAAVQHRRYHKVMGHFRHYINHDPPHTTWIEPHYRGDPALGVTFTERDVSR